MSLKEYQQALAELYTSKNARTSFLKHPQDYLNGHTLGQNDLLQLSNIDATRMHLFSEGLINKRWGIVKSMLLPVFSESLPAMRQMFYEYAQEHSMKGSYDKHQKDTADFCKYLYHEKRFTPKMHHRSFLKYFYKRIDAAHSRSWIQICIFHERRSDLKKERYRKIISILWKNLFTGASNEKKIYL